MFDWFGSKLTSALSSYLVNVVSQLSMALVPVALVALSLWILFYGYAVLRGEVSETVPDFSWKLAKIGFVLALALESGVYIPNIAEAANSVALGVATTFLPDGVTPDMISTPYQLLDEFNSHASKQTFDIMKEASLLRLDLVFAGVLFSFGSVAFLSIGLFLVTLTTVLLTFVVAVGPIFVLCLAWKPTQRFFDSWLSMLLNVTVMTWFTFFALGLSTFLGREIFVAIDVAGGFLGPTLNVLGESLRYCILMIVMAILCFQAPALAAGLTGGPVVQQGIQMIQNALIVAGLRKGNKTVAAASGGSIRGGAGVPYTAGNLVGRGVGAAARAARAARNPSSSNNPPTGRP